MKTNSVHDLYKAKNKLSPHEWEFGYYVFHQKILFGLIGEGKNTEDNDEHMLIYDKSNDWNMPIDMRKVDIIPDTLCQFIGLHDMEGSRAYTGDIVMDGEGRDWIIFAAPGGFRICRVKEYVETNGNPLTAEGLSDLQNAAWFTQNNKIVTNMFDSPEFLRRYE